MARSAREIIDHHVWGGQAALSAYRREYAGSGEYLAVDKQREREDALLESLLAAQALLEAAAYGPDDETFRAAHARWAALEWGGYLDRARYVIVTPLPRPPRPEFLRPR
jgi:hypothetical protein